MTHTRFRRLPVLIVLTAGLAAGSACAGSGSGGNGVASIKPVSDKSTDSDQAGEARNKNTDPEEAMLAFTRCMREHGIDMPDPETTGAGGGVMTFSASASAGTDDGGAPLDPGADKFSEANDACKDLLGDMGPQNMSPEQSKEMQDQALAFSRCMREHGVNMPDPNFDANGGMILKLDDSTGVDPTDPKFEAAQQACGSAFGPAGAKPGAAVSIGGGSGRAGTSGGGSKGGMVIVGGGPVASGGAK